MKKCCKVKNPCKICFQSVCPRNGVQCKGACKKWAHFSCLNYTPGKIQDIKAGYIEVSCPCPSCNTKEKVMSPPNKSIMECHEGQTVESPSKIVINCEINPLTEFLTTTNDDRKNENIITSCMMPDFHSPRHVETSCPSSTSPSSLSPISPSPCSPSPYSPSPCSPSPCSPSPCSPSLRSPNPCSPCPRSPQSLNANSPCSPRSRSSILLSPDISCTECSRSHRSSYLHSSSPRSPHSPSPENQTPNHSPTSKCLPSHRQRTTQPDTGRPGSDRRTNQITSQQRVSHRPDSCRPDSCRVTAKQQTYQNSSHDESSKPGSEETTKCCQKCKASVPNSNPTVCGQRRIGCCTVQKSKSCTCDVQQMLSTNLEHSGKDPISSSESDLMALRKNKKLLLIAIEQMYDTVGQLSVQIKDIMCQMIATMKKTS